MYVSDKYIVAILIHLLYFCRSQINTYIFIMEIAEIKQRLSLSEVIRHYGLKADKQNRLRCPFHEDKTPSMQLYYKTQTAYCFSSNCRTHGKSMDVIDFIMYKENADKHQASEKAKQLINPNSILLNPESTGGDFLRGNDRYGGATDGILPFGYRLRGRNGSRRSALQVYGQGADPYARPQLARLRSTMVRQRQDAVDSDGSTLRKVL